jgi:hypothetical protein
MRDRGSAQDQYDTWDVSANHERYDEASRDEGKYSRARVYASSGRAPDFTLPPWSDRRQGFEALVYRATVRGDAAETRELLQRIERAVPAAPSEPGADALAWSLRSRLALLAGDTVRAIDGLKRAVARIPETYTANYPLTAVGPQRWLLARLLAARGDAAGAERWRRSFTASWSVSDLFYRAGLDSPGSGGISPPRPRSSP